MTRMLLAALALSTAMAAPALAFDPASMSDAEKQAFGEAVREYLMENPRVLIEAVNKLEQQQAANETADDRALVAKYHDELFEDGHSWVGGNLDGDLTIIEFTDYRCPYCRRVAPEIDEVVQKDGNIRVILKEFPILGPESESSTRFALSVRAAAGDDAYKRAHDALMTMQGNVTPDSLAGLASKLGLDPDAIIAGMDSDAISDAIQKNRELAQQMDIRGTPIFIIGDEMLRGVPRAGLQQIVDQIREARDQG